MFKDKWFLIVGTFLLVISGLLIGSILYSSTHPEVVAEKSTSTPSSQLVPTDKPTAPISEVTEIPGNPELSVPVIGVTVPLETVAVTNGEITPPEFDKAYIIEGYSTPQDLPLSGSTYVVFHSVRGGEGIGNKFFDLATGEPTIVDGAEVTVGENTYVVESTEAVSKDELPYRSDIWAGSPGTLYLITCLQTADNEPSTNNFIVKAKLMV